MVPYSAGTGVMSKPEASSAHTHHCEVEHLLCLAVTFWICKKKKKCAYSYILDVLVTVTEKVPFNISVIIANKLYPFHPKPCQTQIGEFLSLPQHTRGVDPES